MTDREAFEKWAESNGFDADKTDEGIYRVKSTPEISRRRSALIDLLYGRRKNICKH